MQNVCVVLALLLTTSWEVGAFLSAPVFSRASSALEGSSVPSKLASHHRLQHGRAGVVMQSSDGPVRRKGARLVKFKAADMEILRPIGEMGFATVTDWEYFGEMAQNPMDPSTPTRTVETEGASIRLFEARVARGSLMGARMLLKEYFPSAKELAAQELRVYSDIVEDWAMRTDDDFSESPVATLRGWFETTFECRQPAFVNNWKERFPRAEPPAPGNTWLVFRWDGGQALPALWSSKQQTESFWDKLAAPAWGSNAARQSEMRYIRQVMKNSIAALAFLHDRQVLHRSLGGPSIVLSSIKAEDSASLQVKLRDFGFASRASQLDETTLSKARQAGASTPSEVFAFLAAEDCYALGYTLMETVFTVLTRDKPAPEPRGRGGLMKSWLQQAKEGRGENEQPLGPVTLNGPGGAGAGIATDQSALKRLVEDVFEFDVRGRFREYCEGTEEWGDVVAFLDEREGAGWALFEAMLNEPRRTQRRRSSADRKAGKESVQPIKELSEMSDEEVSNIQIPSFIPKQVRVSTVSSARGLLASDMFSDLSTPWWLPMASTPMQTGELDG